jgi:competence protein ComGC
MGTPLTEGKRLCPGCGLENLNDLRFCRRCGLEFTREVSGDESLVIDLPEPEQGKRPWWQISLVEVVIVVSIIGMLAAIAIPGFSSAKKQAREKACYANMRVILGAVEMYNMDHPDPMISIEDSTVADPASILISKTYLKTTVSRPERGCFYGSVGNLASDGHIICRSHGTVE